MMKRLLPIGLVVLAANGAAVLMVARNAAETPDSRLRLTEREVRLPAVELDKSGIMLRVAWHGPWATHSLPAPWLTPDKLASLGFDCRVPPDSMRAARHYSYLAQPSRFAYVVLDYDRDWPGEKAPDTPGKASQSGEGAGNAAAGAVVKPSQLRAVDAGTDARALRARYPDRSRFLITQGTVRVTLKKPSADAPHPVVGGMVDMVLPAELYVPTRWQPTFRKLARKDVRDMGDPLDHEPRYEVTVEYGRNLMPRIVNVRAR